MALTKRQRAFIEIYCANPNMGKADAARKAGYSSTCAAQYACRLMKDPEVMRSIDHRLAQRVNERLGVAERKAEHSPDAVTQELWDVLEECRAAGAGNWQMTARTKAAELLGKIYGMFKEKVEHSLDEQFIERLAEARQRARLEAPKLLDAKVISENVN